ncbi:MAG: Glu-tRNA(Gln) amidotransferase GatDE subunit E [Acidobacteria bacterium]|nr:MAG: Glu-tRNA(Gln) amidotransferase GatDE subunit E [Acidobacteriota bacterium]
MPRPKRGGRSGRPSRAAPRAGPGVRAAAFRRAHLALGAGEPMATDTPRAAAGVRPPADLNPEREPPLDFPARDLDEMTPDDYRALNFMSGLEVHQQLLTESKLFCRCPAGRYVDRYDAEVLRHMRPTLSELGEYDGCALMEFKTKKEIVYLLERGTVCTYEIDDTPPFEIDREAVLIALEIARLFDLKLVSELHVMRKQYLDGSIPTGFQRTAMVGLSGAIPFREPELGVDKLLRIRQLSLEEDSCREVSDIGHRITFRTDRLGMPLTEVVTEPDLLTPWELQAGARLVARTTRCCRKVRRGPGAARQDVNVSIAGGRRIEIKGVDNHRRLPLLAHIEAFRQLELLKIREELRRRGVQREMLEIPAGGAAWDVSPLAVRAERLLAGAGYRPLAEALERGEAVAALRLPRFGGLLSRPTQPRHTFAFEFAERVRVIACLTARPFMVHSDLAGYGLSRTTWRRLRRALQADPEDALVVVWGDPADLDTAVREIFIRAQDALEGVPPETRQAHRDGSTGFERILAGPDRMYPDTDTPPLPIPDEWVDRIEAGLPERPWQRESRYREAGLDERAAARLAASPWADLFDALGPLPAETARRVAAAFARVLAPRRPSLPPPHRVRPLAAALAAGRLLPEGFELALARVTDSPDADPGALLAELEPDAGGRLADQAVARALEQLDRLRTRDPEAALRWAMGTALAGVRGRVPAREVRARLVSAMEGRLEAR